eukprot:scaffold421_cov125-Isochrysis_galbana.AAC.7
MAASPQWMSLKLASHIPQHHQPKRPPPYGGGKQTGSHAAGRTYSPSGNLSLEGGKLLRWVGEG